MNPFPSHQDHLVLSTNAIIEQLDKPMPRKQSKTVEIFCIAHANHAKLTKALFCIYYANNTWPNHWPHLILSIYAKLSRSDVPNSRIWPQPIITFSFRSKNKTLSCIINGPEFLGQTAEHDLSHYRAEPSCKSLEPFLALLPTTTGVIFMGHGDSCHRSKRWWCPIWYS